MTKIPGGEPASLLREEFLNAYTNIHGPLPLYANSLTSTYDITEEEAKTRLAGWLVDLPEEQITRYEAHGLAEVYGRGSFLIDAFEIQDPKPAAAWIKSRVPLTATVGFRVVIAAGKQHAPAFAVKFDPDRVLEGLEVRNFRSRLSAEVLGDAELIPLYKAQ